MNTNEEEVSIAEFCQRMRRRLGYLYYNEEEEEEEEE